MLEGRPLYDNDADARYFIAPPEWDILMRAIRRRLNVLVTGKRGTGKTTLLRQVQLALRSEGERVAFVDTQGVQGGLELAALLRDGVENSSGEVSRGEDSSAILAHLEALGRAPPTIVLVDASGSAAAAYEIFGRMRDTLWQFEHRWIVAVDEDERATVLNPPADAFFDTVISLEPLSRAAVVDLLKKRDKGLPQRQRQRIAAGAQGNPRAALRAANRAIIYGLEPADQWAERADVMERASALGRPHAMLMAELLDLGQASPSDDVLQHRLGLSRARLTQLLRELLDHELVETGVERPEGPGRPKTIYHPAIGRG